METRYPKVGDLISWSHVKATSKSYGLVVEEEEVEIENEYVHNIHDIYYHIKWVKKQDVFMTPNVISKRDIENVLNGNITNILFKIEE
jgi:hypothetical protein